MRINRSTSFLLSAVVALAVAAPAAAQRDEGESPQDVKDQGTTELFFVCDDDDTNNAETTTTRPADDDYIEFDGDLKMWPPNHKYQTVTLLAVDGDEDGDLMSFMSSVTHDEYIPPFADTSGEEPEEEVGAGNTADDASPFVAMGEPGSDDLDGDGAEEDTLTTQHEIRSERSGRGDGRTYRLTTDAMFGQGECTFDWDVEVPHDMRSHKAPAKEDKTDSTGPNQG